MRFFTLLLLSSLALYADMSIKEAWLNTQNTNKGLKASSSDLTRAELKREAAKSMYLPSVTLTGNYTHLSEPVSADIAEFSAEANTLLAALGSTSTIPPTLDLTKQDVFLADLQVLWPLYTGGKIDAAQDVYAAEVDEFKALKEMKKDEEFLKLVKYYYGVVLSESLYQTRLEAKKALELHYQNAKYLRDEGQIANIELLNAEVKLDEAKIDARKSRYKLEIASSALESLTKDKTQPSSKLFVNEYIEDEAYYKLRTQENYSGLKILDAKAKQSDSVVTVKEAAWFPQIAAYGNYNLYKDDSALMSTLPTWFAGVLLKIDLLQRSDRSQEVEAAKLLNSKVKYLKEEAIENLSLLVEKTYKEMLSDKEEFNSLNSSIKLAEENYRLRDIAFKEGLSTSVELVDAQMFLMGAKTKRLNAAYNYVQKVAQLSVLSGEREKLFEIIEISQEIK